MNDNKLIIGGIEVNTESSLSIRTPDMLRHKKINKLLREVKSTPEDIVIKHKLYRNLEWQFIELAIYLAEAYDISNIPIKSDNLLKKWPELVKKQYITVNTDNGSNSPKELFLYICSVLPEIDDKYINKRTFPVLSDELKEFISTLNKKYSADSKTMNKDDIIKDIIRKDELIVPWLNQVEQYYILIAKDLHDSIIGNEGLSG